MIQEVKKTLKEDNFGSSHHTEDPTAADDSLWTRMVKRFTTGDISQLIDNCKL